MKQLIAFTKKEFIELWRTNKIVILFFVAMILGFQNPIVAKITPDLMKNFMPKGIVVNLPKPTVFDSYAQFFKNMVQMGMIIFVLMFSTIMQNEIKQKTLVILLTKGLKRCNVVISKFIVSYVMWTLFYFLSFTVTFLYNMMFWKYEVINNLLLSVTLPWVFGLMLISIVIFGGILFKSYVANLLVLIGGVFSMFLFNFIDFVGKYSPLNLVSINMQLILNRHIEQNICVSVVITLGISFVLFILSILVFNKKEI